MNNSLLNSNDCISVVPRIIDPNMKFTKESLEQIDNLKRDKICKKKEQILESKQHINTKNTNEQLIEIGFFTKYKSYILVIIILILICFIIFLLFV